MPTAANLSFREALPSGGGDPRGVVVFLHGFPESSYMWRDHLDAVAAAGWRGVAPDLAGFGDSPVDRPATWERHVESIGRLHDELDLGRVVLVMHDWGGLIGLRWACENPDLVRGLVVSSTGFFADGRWHGFAEALRTPDEGERLIDAMTRDGLEALLDSLGSGFDGDAVDEYWRGFADEERRRAILDFYRSCNFEEIERYDGCLESFAVPALVLWGAEDEFAPIGGAHRFVRTMRDARLVVVDGARHFLYEDAPERTAQELVSYLDEL